MFSDNKNRYKKLLVKYSKSMTFDYYSFYTSNNIPDRIIKNLSKNCNFSKDSKLFIGAIDTSVLSNGGCGYVFFENKIIIKQSLDKPIKVYYEDVKDVKYKKDSNNNIIFTFVLSKNKFSFDCYQINPQAFNDYIKEIINLNNNNYDSYDKTITKLKNEYNINKIAGQTVSNKCNIKKLHDEYKLNGKQGHGFAAEFANDFDDKLKGKKAKIIGDNNAKNGPDRLIFENGQLIKIQTKYCETGKKCIDACFDKRGNFRYYSCDVIEVPKDKYQEALKAMEYKIKANKIEGVTEVSEAKNIVKAGNVTYQQAKNIAKAGNIDSIIYDSKTGAVISTSAFGITSTITFATLIWNGESFDHSIKLATVSGVKAFQTAFFTSVISSQISKAGLNSALVGSSKTIMKVLGKSTYTNLANAFRKGAVIKGAYALNSASKILRGNVITSGAAVLVLSSVDIFEGFNGKISAKQGAKNFIKNTFTIFGGIPGMLVGAPGGPVGIIAGATATSTAIGKATEKILNKFIKDDSEDMLEIIQNAYGELINEYMLTVNEIEKIVDNFAKLLNSKLYKNMYASGDRKKFAKKFLVPIIEKQIKKRRKINIDDYYFNNSIKEIFNKV